MQEVHQGVQSAELRQGHSRSAGESPGKCSLDRGTTSEDRSECQGQQTDGKERRRLTNTQLIDVHSGSLVRTKSSTISEQSADRSFRAIQNVTTTRSVGRDRRQRESAFIPPLSLPF